MNDFNFDLNPSQILSEIADLESVHTHIFNNESDGINQEVNFVEVPKETVLKQTFEYNIDTFEKEPNKVAESDNDSGSNEMTSFSSKPTQQIDQVYSQQLFDIFDQKRNKCNSLASRKDVINKTILRGFKKFFVILLDIKSIKPSRLLKRSKSSLKLELIRRAKELGLLKLIPKNNSSQDEFEELLGWIGFPKITTKVHNLFSDNNKAISILNDILLNYSHRKLNQVLECKQIMSLFRHFAIFGKEKFMKGIIHNTSNDLSPLSINSE